MNVNERVSAHIQLASEVATSYATEALYRNDNSAKILLDVIAELQKAILILATEVERLDGEQKRSPSKAD